MKYVKTASVVFLVIIANVIIWYLPMFPYVPVFNIKENGSDQEWRRMPFKLSENEFLAVSRALSDGAEHYFKLRSKHKVLITLSLFMDTELLGNYTSKAGLACPDSSFKMDSYGLWVEKRKQGLKSENRSGTVPARFPGSVKRYSYENKSRGKGMLPTLRELINKCSWRTELCSNTKVEVK